MTGARQVLPRPGARPSRRSVCAAGLALVLASAPRLRAAGRRGDERLLREDWTRFRARFVTSEGRVVDTGGDGVSHSEGQGYGMLLATACDDPGAFLALWRWTRETLQVRDDALLAWRWRPGAGIDDPNNASDGDLLVAWALLRAHARWGEEAWRGAALEILADLAARCVVSRGRSRLLLPGAEGFVRDDAVVVNPSYWVFPALADVAEAAPDGPWRDVFGTGEALIEAFGSVGFGLAPDWCAVGEAIGPAEGFSYAFGFDAIRVPLYYAWAAPRPRAARFLAPYARYARRFGAMSAVPAILDLETGETADYPLSLGGRTVLFLAESVVAGSPVSPDDLPSGGDDLDYYASILILLSKIAAKEMHL